MLLSWFFDSLLLTCPKKMETEKWAKAADSPLLIHTVLTSATSHQQNFQMSVSCHSAVIAIVYSRGPKVSCQGCTAHPLAHF